MVRPIGNKIVVSPPIVIDKDQCDTIISAINDSILEFAASR